MLGDREAQTQRLAELREEVAVIFSTNAMDKPKQALQFFRNKAWKDTGGSQVKGDCMFCMKSVTSTGAFRMQEHLLDCPLAFKEVKEAVKKLKQVTDGKRKRKMEEKGLILREAELQATLIKEQKRQMIQQGIREGFKATETEVADLAIARFFYANALSFAAADHHQDSIYQEMVRAIRNTPASYIPPNRCKIAGALLDKCFDAMQKEIAARGEDGSSADKFGVAYTQDGWDSCDHLPLINSAYITCNDGGVYQRSVDTSGHTKDAEYIASLMICDIYSIGCLKVVMVVTDTCSTMRKAWSYVEDEFPWVSCIPCIPHVASLLAKDIGKIPEVADVIKDEGTLTSWFSLHQKPLAILRRKVRESLGKTYELIKAGATRFGTHTYVGERLLKIKNALKQTVVDDEYLAENYKDAPNEVEETNCTRQVRENKGGTAKQLVNDDDGFWKRVESHVECTMPIIKFLRRHDSSAPTVGKVYHGFFSIGEHLKTTSAGYKKEAEQCFNTRWEYGHAPFFAAAYCVDPEYRTHDQGSNEEVQEGLMDTMEKLGILIEARRLQKLDGRCAACAYTLSECTRSIHAV